MRTQFGPNGTFYLGFLFGTLAVTRATVQVPTAATKMARTGAINAGKRTWRSPFPQHARGACCRKNSPHHSSNKRMGGRRRDAVQPGNEVPHDPADKPGKNNFEGNDVGVNNSFAIVAATARERNAPTKFNTADSATAILGRKARVAMDVAMALPVSWKPFVKSKASAVATTRTRSVISFTGSMVPEGVRLANGL